MRPIFSKIEHTFGGSFFTLTKKESIMSSFFVTPNSLNWQKCSQKYEDEEIWLADGLHHKGEWGATATKMIYFRERTEKDEPSETNCMVAEIFHAESFEKAKALAWNIHLAELKSFLNTWFKIENNFNVNEKKIPFF